MDYTTNSSGINFPKLCPHCGIANNPITNNLTTTFIQGEHINVFTHDCNVCKEKHVTVQKKLNSEYIPLACYPNKQPLAKLNPILVEHAPIFAEFYNEALEAEQLDLINLAGTGYRSAIECLIKDYALDFELDTQDNIKKLSFSEAVDKYVNNDELLRNAITVIRKIGNDFTHWETKYDFPLSTLKSYVDIVVTVFTSKFLMKYPPIR